MNPFLSNKEIARAFNALGKIMELHGENPFKIRSYYSAYNTLRKWPVPLAELNIGELNEIKGIGKAISSKIIELVETGEMAAYKKYEDITPPGIIHLLQLKGVGPKKIKQLWKELGIESAGELLYACNENRLIELKGFGSKTQENLKAQLEYFIRSSGKFLYARVIDHAEEICRILSGAFPDHQFRIVGKLAMNYPVVEMIELLTSGKTTDIRNHLLSLHHEINSENEKLLFRDIPL
ncbi:MAG: helix-hairpin-helix domain-containing protein, partial [Melioribacteraceae bacterium]|nr:helix-hairpin-helix domain-containing protein [Melioribacteraceae bacterium]